MPTLVVTLVISSLLVIISSFASLTILHTQLVKSKFISSKAFYLAEAGIEWAQWKLSKDPAWATDPPHSPRDDKKWLVQSALGYKLNLEDGYYKIVKELGKKTIYSIGYAESQIKIIRIAEDWEEL